MSSDNETSSNVTVLRGDPSQKTNYQRMVEDLAQSFLEPEDLSARPIEGPERAATKTPNSVSGYVIPYYDIFGKVVPHYRVRLFEGDPKYRQPKDSSSYIYFPKGFLKAVKERPYILITEGEKKAALATKLGIPTVGLGGVDAWKNRIISIPGEPTLSAKGPEESRVTKAKADPGMEISEDHMANLATGMQDLVDLSLQTSSTIIICFDSDRITGVQPQVQRAAATLGYELRSKGVAFTNIRQIILPWDTGIDLPQTQKMGLDDFLLAEHGEETFQFLISQCLQKRIAFPRHPSVMDYVNRRLQKGKMSRKEKTHVAMAILCELDSTGMRLRSPETAQPYYFDYDTKTLMKVGFLYGGSTDEGHETDFGGLLYRRFGLSSDDQRALVWLSAQFNGELPIGAVSPERVIATHKREDVIRYQLSDGEYCTIDANGLSIEDNGAHGILFEAGHVLPTSGKELATEFRKRAREPLTNWWDETLEDTRILDHDKAQALHSLLYYISPWLNRWRGMQLPIEIVLGESGSGKSTLATLRLEILTGVAKLRNTPQDIKDWHASIVNSGGLHVTDNAQLTDKALRQRLSDELCRIVTEPNPVVEQRKYFTNTDVVRFPVRCVFGFTAIAQPFQNADVLQRSVILQLDKPSTPHQGQILFDMDWVERHMQKKGGRTAWLSHHLWVLHKFFQAVQRDWQPNYIARHRLVNLEQTLMILATLFRMDASWIPSYLVGISENNITAVDWAFEGIDAYLRDWVNGNPKHNEFGPFILASDIAEWAATEVDYRQNEILINPRKLGRYMQTHKSMLATILGLYQNGKEYNRVRYVLVPKKGVDKSAIQRIRPTPPTAIGN